MRITLALTVQPFEFEPIDRFDEFIYVSYSTDGHIRLIGLYYLQSVLTTQQTRELLKWGPP